MNGPFVRSQNRRNHRRWKKAEWVNAAGVILACAAFGFYALTQKSGTSSGAANGTSQPAILFSLKSLVFGSQTVGTVSGAQIVTVTNESGAVVRISKIGVSGNFAETNTCGTSMKAGATCTISVTFKAAASGILAGSLAIEDSAAGSPQSIPLSGTGAATVVAGGGNTGMLPCASTAITQAPADVTSQMSYVNTAGGAEVSQLTDNGTSRFYYFDVPAYSAKVNQILYVNFAIGNEIVTSNTDGTLAQIISPTLTGSQAFLSADGSLAYYDKPVKVGTPGGEDIYGVFLGTSGVCEEIHLTTLDIPPMKPLPVWEISTASLDAAGGDDIAFSPDTLVHRIHVETSGTSVPLATITLNDPESNATIHRLRMNPKFPNIVMYKRNEAGSTTAQPEVWLADLNTCTNGVCSASEIINVVAKLVVPANHVPKGGHINWSPDGLHIAFSEPDKADYWMARNVVNANGTINKAFTLQELGPFAKPEMTADYCAFPPNWPTSTVLACLAGPGSASHPDTFYLMSSDGKGTTKLLAASDAKVLTIDGTPMPAFAQDDQHVMFNSDRTGVPQIYMIKGFLPTVP
jgi:hypothetical protein